MKPGDLVKHRSTGQMGVVVNIKKAGFGHLKLDLIRCFSLKGGYFNTHGKNLEIINESR